jgi:dipeptidyl aminopeptidase/acylaminoacyl peptidase
MAGPQIAPFGSWQSPLTPERIVGVVVNLQSPMLDGTRLYWLEGRPTEGGRNVLLRRTADGAVAECTPAPFNVRSRVHEYGGGAYLPAGDTVYCVNYADQQIYRLAADGPPTPLTPPGPWRYADFVLDATRNRLIAVREDHGVPDASRNAVAAVVAISLDGGDSGTVLVQGHDFYSNPRLSPDGSRLAWLAWDHPNLPWDGTDLWVAPLDAKGAPGTPLHVAGGPEESIFQPEWGTDGALYFVSDRTGWWNLYRWDGTTTTALCPMEAEFGAPQWGFRTTTYGFAGADRIVAAYSESGAWQLGTLPLTGGPLTTLDQPYRMINNPVAGANRVVFVGATPTSLMALVDLDLTTGTATEVRESSRLTVEPDYMSLPETVAFPTIGGATAYGFLYAPQNPAFAAPDGERPPLLVFAHGGPTSATVPVLRLSVLYWTSRGFAVLDVNYGGSTGYGRAYRERLNGQWGVVDVEDCLAGARYLVSQGRADGKRLAISGGSAGGYTVLAATAFHNLFGAGASHFGISDLEADAQGTHKFESRYSDRMIGPLPEAHDLYRARSPLFFADQVSCPLIFFQGLDDPIVLPAQSEAMVDALRKRGVPVAYLAFPGEGHGFRQAATQRRTLEAELYFYSRIFGFSLADPVEPVAIENLDR